jgi:hypothetical protein
VIRPLQTRRQQRLTAAGLRVIRMVCSKSHRIQEFHVSCSERKRELRRRRHRRKKVSIFARKLQKATVSEKGVIAEKLRSLTPGGDQIVTRWDLEKR